MSELLGYCSQTDVKAPREDRVCRLQRTVCDYRERGQRLGNMQTQRSVQEKTVIPGSVTSTTENSRHVSQMIGLSCNGSRKP